MVGWKEVGLTLRNDKAALRATAPGEISTIGGGGARSRRFIRIGTKGARFFIRFSGFPREPGRDLASADPLLIGELVTGFPIWTGLGACHIA